MGSTEEATVTVTNFRYEPPTLEVPTGTTVTWVNQDEILHTVTSGTPEGATVPGVSEGAAAEPDGRFDEELDGGGATVEVTLDERGTYTYFCAIHGGMVGEIIVG
ncbi:MAG TPA: plastocyanin/azurin family copper-binding protein [Actinomycetota bacterium]|nr:plastocyanin/azurin family copper-binding protein [Actinomycetota bacterium]